MLSKQRPDNDAAQKFQLLAACRLVGAKRGIQFYEGTTIEEIATRAGVRYRSVALNGDWWQAGGLPILGYIAEMPVALLPQQRGYMMKIPGREPIPVTPETAQSISNEGILFYKSFPDRTLRYRDVLGFGFHGAVHDLVSLAIAAALSGVCFFLFPSIASWITNASLPGMPDQSLQVLVIVAIVIGALVLLNLSVETALARLNARISEAQHAALWDRLLRLPASSLADQTVEDIMQDALTINTVSYIRVSLQSAALIVNVMALVLFTGSAYAPVVGLLLLTFATLWLVASRQEKLERTQRHVQTLTEQLISTMNIIRVFRGQQQAYAYWRTSYRTRKHEWTLRQLLDNTTKMLCVAYGVFIVVWTALATQSLPAWAQAGAFVACAQLLLTLTITLPAIMKLGSEHVLYRDLVLPFLAPPPETAQVSDKAIVLKGAITLEHVECGILHDLSLKIEAGQCVAVVGKAGSGKSTLLRLLLGLEQVESGRIFYDEVDSCNFDMPTVRRQLGAVLQSDHIHAGSILSNITRFKSVTMDDAWRAAEVADLDGFIRQLPMEMHTLLDRDGMVLSQGQRQRLLLARAVVASPRIVLLDEATHTLGKQSRQAIYAHLAALNITRVMVTNQRDIAKQADQIIILDNGRVVQIGRYDEVLPYLTMLT